MWCCLFRSVLHACVKSNRWKLLHWINNAWKQTVSIFTALYSKTISGSCMPALIKVKMTKSFPWVLLWTTPPLVLPFFPSVFPEERNSAEVYSTGGGGWWEVRFYGSHCWNDSLPLIYVFQLSTHFLSPLLTVGEHSEGARLGSEVSKIKGRPTECVRVFGLCSVIIQDSIYVDVLWFCCWVTAQGVWGDGKWVRQGSHSLINFGRLVQLPGVLPLENYC